MKYLLPISFVSIVSISGCGQQAPSSNQSSTAPSQSEKSCDASKMKIGSCLTMAGIEFNSPIAKLMANGNFTYQTHVENGECYADMKVSGSVDGNSYNKSFSCKVVN